MPIEFNVLNKAEVATDPIFSKVHQTVVALRTYLELPTVQNELAAAHVIGASSARIQEIVQRGAEPLGFKHEKTGLFSNYSVSALRPDYFAAVEDTGILLEVERGKTTTNNMDLLDFWKCHICEQARFLFLVVPQARPSKNGKVLRHFRQVNNRLGTFFLPQNYVNVDAVHIFGY